jgi:flagellar basal body rod protein FlgG
MLAQQRRLDVIANNLANVSTRGFKGDHLTFGDMMIRAMADDSGASVGTLASGPTAETQTTDFTQGSLEHTGNPLDLALNGQGMFAVGTPDGVRYTRDGSFTLNSSGALVTKNGQAVLDENSKPIAGLSGAIEVDTQGRVHPVGKAQTLATIGRFDGSFAKDPGGKNLYTGDKVRAFGTTEGPQVASEQLEASNVEPISLMAEMISLQRAYEISQKMVQSQDESTAKLAETMG